MRFGNSRDYLGLQSNLWGRTWRQAATSKAFDATGDRRNRHRLRRIAKCCPRNHECNCDLFHSHQAACLPVAVAVVIQTRMMQAHAGSPPRQELVRAIGRWSLVALVVNLIIGSGVFGLPSVVAGLLGRASVLAILVAGAAIAVVMACFAEVASQFTEPGGPYLYVRAAFGRLLGIQVGWLAWLVRIAACAANANLFVVYLGEFWVGARQPLARLLILSLLIGHLAAINYRGVRMGTHVSNTFTVAKLLPLGLVCVAGAFYLIGHGATPAVKVFPGGQAWLRALLLLVFAYGGFEAALMPMGEVKDPHRDAAFGLFAALGICSAIYVLIQWNVVGLLSDPGRSERPLADVARIVMGRGGAALVAVGALVSVYGNTGANILAIPRMTFAMAERGDFPSWFAAVHSRFRTPYFSILIFALLVWMLALFGSFAGNATLSAVARLSYYGLVCAALPVLRKKNPKAKGFRLPGGTIFAVAGTLLCFGLLVRTDLSHSLILAVTVALAFVNWAVVAARRASK
jgi:APA family basic amino acid/polyamine antiporter